MIDKYLKDLSDEDLKELYQDKRYCLNRCYNLSKQLGNAKAEDNTIIKGYISQIEAIKKELKERGL